MQRRSRSRHSIDGIREATSLPLLWIGRGRARERRRDLPAARGRVPASAPRARRRRPRRGRARAGPRAARPRDLPADRPATTTTTPTRSTRCSSCCRMCRPESWRSRASTSRPATRCSRWSERASTPCWSATVRSRTSSATSRSRSEREAGYHGAVRGLLVAASCSVPARCSPPAAARRRRRAAAAPRRAARSRTAPTRPGWQKLANRIKAPVYCPGWLPDPLKGQIGGRWNNIDSVSADRSYLESFVWQETGGGAARRRAARQPARLPGRTTIPTCRTAAATAGTSRASPTRAARSPRTGSRRASTRSTRTPTRGTPAALAPQRHALHALRARRAAARRSITSCGT